MPSYYATKICVLKKNDSFFYKFIYFIYLFLAVLGLHCSPWASHCGGFSCCRAWGLGPRASVVVAHRLQSAGSVVVVHGLSCSWHVGFSRTKARTCVPCLGRRSLNHCATREAQEKIFYTLSFSHEKSLLHFN